MLWKIILFILGLLWMPTHADDDLCPGATTWETFNLPRSNFGIELSRAEESSWAESFCCCRSRGMRLLSPTTEQDMQDLYADLVEVGVLQNEEIIEDAQVIQLGHTDYHEFGPKTMNVYGVDDIPEIASYNFPDQPNNIFLLAQDTNSFAAQKLGFRLNAGDRDERFPVWYFCTDQNPNTALKDIDKCFRSGKQCNSAAIETLATTGYCTPDPPLPCPTPPPCQVCARPSTTQFIGGSASGCSSSGCSNGGWWPFL